MYVVTCGMSGRRKKTVSHVEQVLNSSQALVLTFARLEALQRTEWVVGEKVIEEL